jgi:hypothetical protein
MTLFRFKDARPRDFQGNERCEGYRIGDHEPCYRCKATGVDPVVDDPSNVCGNFCGTSAPVCRVCGGYGDVGKSCVQAA